MLAITTVWKIVFFTCIFVKWSPSVLYTSVRIYYIGYWKRLIILFQMPSLTFLLCGDTILAKSFLICDIASRDIQITECAFFSLYSRVTKEKYGSWTNEQVKHHFFRHNHKLKDTFFYQTAIRNLWQILKTQPQKILMRKKT